ncbi:MAG: type IV pilus secretin PilQ [Candidatus Mycalebacterium zealandia]|nr:MAG: type IV pilus secretin PilQ [Candidatus Mycalebacterium zealandia]
MRVAKEFISFCIVCAVFVFCAPALSAAQNAPDSDVAWAFDFRYSSFGADEPVYRGGKGTFIYKGADTREVIMQIAQIGGFNIIITGDVSGTVYMELRDVPWDQVLSIVLAENGLGAFVEGNVVKISSLENISKRRREASDTAQLVEKTEKLVSKQFFVNYATARDIATGIKPFLTKQGRISVDERTNSLAVLETRLNIARIGGIVKSLDKPTPKILIESRIVQAGTDFSRELGIQWGTRYTSKNTGARFPASIQVGRTRIDTAFGNVDDGFIVDMPAAVGTGSGGVLGVVLGNLAGTFDLDIRLSALEDKGKVKILSSPKIITVDNSVARIEQGISIPFSTVSEQGTKTEFADATLSLEVKPKITNDGNIFMDISITDNSPDATFAVGSQPSIRRNEAKTRVLAEDGETIVLGGIVTTTTTTSKSSSKVPVLSSIPLLGSIFKSSKRQTVERELILFITPRIVS